MAVLPPWPVNGWGLFPPAFFGQPPKCEVAHTSLSSRPSKVRHGDIYLARQEGTHGTKTRTS
jgi:hypothetical protein